MPSPLLAEIVDSVTRARGVMKSATALINGFRARLEAAIAEATANGATPAELEPLSELDTALEGDIAELSTAVAANP